MIIAVTIAVLVAGGVYMILQRGMVRIVFGMGLVSHATNLLILATGIGAWRSEPVAAGVCVDGHCDHNGHDGVYVDAGGAGSFRRYTHGGGPGGRVATGDPWPYRLGIRVGGS